MNSYDSRLSLYSPLRSIKEFSPSDVPCEYDEHQMDIEIPDDTLIDTTTLGLKSQLLTSPNVIDIISRVDVEKMSQNTHAYRDFTLEDFNNVQINDFDFCNVKQPLENEEEQEAQEQKEKEKKAQQNQQSQVHQNMLLQNQVESPIFEETFKVFPKITSKDIQKATFNFGKTAIGTYMLKLIKKGWYDKFINDTLRRNETFISGFKKFCLRVDYQTRHDFKFVWRNYDDFNDSSNGLYNFYVALKKITQEFLGKEVYIWIEKKTKRKDYIPIYTRIAEVYGKGVENVENFKFSDFFKSRCLYFY